MKQYPYILEVLYLSGGGQDADGNAIEPTKNWLALARCRDEAGNGKSVATQDGIVHQFSFLVQLPKGVEAFKAGTQIRVKDGAEIRCLGSVIYSRKDQFHTRLWV